MALLYEHSTLVPIPFKITKNGDGLAGFTFATNDIMVSVDNAAWVDATPNIAEQVGSGLGKGWYRWTPAAGQTTAVDVVFNVAQLTGTDFDENGMVVQLGGNAGAWLNG